MIATTLPAERFLFRRRSASPAPVEGPGRARRCVGAMLLTLALSLASFGVAVAQTTPPGTTTVVNDGPGDQTDPHISGDYVSYTSNVDGENRIRYHNLVTGDDAVVPHTDQSDFLSDVSGNRIAFTRIETSSSIYTYQIGAAAATEVAPSGAVNRRNPAIGADTVAWQDFGFHASSLRPEIVVHDLATNTTTRLTNDELLDRTPAVSPDGNVVVWAKCETNGTGCDIWKAVRAGALWTTSAVTGSEGEETAPDSNGTVIVYASTRAGETDIYYKSVTGGAETRLSLSGTQSNPSISGSLIAFDHRDASGSSDILVWDMATSTLYRVPEPTSTSNTNETLNDIWVGSTGLATVVYQSDATGDFNVYAFSFLPASVPATVTLSPAADTNPVGTDHTVTATVKDASDPPNPVANVVVRFSVTGSVTASGFCTTDSNGQCSFTYSGPSLPGADLISAYADTDGDGVQDADEPVAEPATKAWVLPTSTAGQASGGGHITDATAGKVAFGFSAKSKDGTFQGQCNVIDPGNRMIKCLDVTALVISGNEATIYGNATDNGVATTYVLKVADNADPGKGADTLSITTASGYSASGTLTAGNIQVGP
jgi:hypothetical protein